MKNGKPRILFFDLESAGVNALKPDLGFVIVFGYKWSDEDEAKALTIRKKDLKNFDDKNLLTKASAIIEEADLLVTHFGSVFDRRYIQGRLLIHGLPPIPPTKMRDTCMIARSVANFSSNRLKYLAKILGLKNQKLENNWPTAWFEVMQGNTEALAGLAEYCKGDVLALEELYYRLLAFDNLHPRMVMDSSVCPIDGGQLMYSGFAYVGERKYRRFVCKQCGKWGRERKAIK